MADEQCAELAQPGVGMPNAPSPPAVSQFATIFMLSAPDRAQSVQYVASSASRAVGPSHRRGWRSPASASSADAPGARDPNFGECGFHNFDLFRRGAFQPSFQWKTMSVDQYHQFRLFPGLVLHTAELLLFLDIQCLEQWPPCIQPYAFLFPLLQRPTAGRWRSDISIEQKPQTVPVSRTHRMPSGQGPVRCPRPSLIVFFECRGLFRIGIAQIYKAVAVCGE